MTAQTMRRMIDEAMRDEEETHRLRNQCVQMARQNGNNPTDADLDSVVGWVKTYVCCVPEFVEQAHAAAVQVGIGNEMDFFCAQIEDYWRNMHDVVPDHMGLMGILDDAYASAFLIQEMSAECVRQGRGPLVEEGDLLVDLNRSVRQLLGYDVANVLERKVGETIQLAAAQTMMNSILAQVNFAAMHTPDPIWGNASIQDRVNVQLGAMGIF